MKKRLICLILLITPLLSLLSGCEKTNVTGIEVSKSIFTRAIGVDKSKVDSENVRVTVVAKKATSAKESSPSSGEEGAIVINSEGRTILEAIRKIQSFSSNPVFFGHANVFLIGEEMLRDDVVKAVDFFIRDHEFRYSASVVAVKGASAEDFLISSLASDTFISEKIESLLEGADAVSYSKDRKVYEVFSALSNEYASLLLPCVEAVSTSVKTKDDKGKTDVYLNGFALFKEEKLFDFATFDVARGINWANNDVKSAVMVVKDMSDKNVSLEVITSEAKIKPKLKDATLNVDIEIQIRCNLDEQYSSLDLFSKEGAKYLTEQLNITVKQEVEKAIDATQPYAIDVFNLADKVYHKHPLKWHDIKDNWEQIYKAAKINVEVKSIIKGVYFVIDPIKDK